MPLLLMDRLDMLRRVFDILPIGIWICDQAGNIQYGNAAGRAIWKGAHYVGPERYGEYKGWWVATGKRIRPQEWGAARAIASGEVSIDEEIEIECFDGSHKFILHSALPVRDEAGGVAGVIVVNHDITERKHLEEQLRTLVDRDPLTGAWNRRALFEFLSGEIARARRHRTPLAVVMFDIDHFKRVNDRYGHQAGDAVLARLAEVVRAELRGGDRLVRYGGEEFLVIAPGIGLKQAAALASRLRRMVAATRFEALPRITCSFGACAYEKDADADALIRRVDDLLYAAKQAGRNRVVAAHAAKAKRAAPAKPSRASRKRGTTRGRPTRRSQRS
jgi:diguanylate cyclase (GGDEF)-like protein